MSEGRGEEGGGKSISMSMWWRMDEMSSLREEEEEEEEALSEFLSWLVCRAREREEEAEGSILYSSRSCMRGSVSVPIVTVTNVGQL